MSKEGKEEALANPRSFLAAFNAKSCKSGEVLLPNRTNFEEFDS